MPWAGQEEEERLQLQEGSFGAGLKGEANHKGPLGGRRGQQPRSCLTDFTRAVGGPGGGGSAVTRSREGVAWALGGSPAPGARRRRALGMTAMQLRRTEGRWPPRRRWLLLLGFGLGGVLPGLAEAPSPAGMPPERSRPYAVLRGQNLVLMGSIFSILLVTMILMAICVYKPLRRR
ncbi:uncharacterized protein C12orf76 homolog [Dromiciops gliroides]|uniref:uncharacterized protein C12orf76 homolog n=1 Tax=Dromiciops gliroides TaxID=33562 RepID=UPI001CC79170|nr:uncharacterized protein C12orf76 homolog [Dromiciops gliroides]